LAFFDLLNQGMVLFRDLAPRPLPKGLRRRVASQSPTANRFVSNTDARWQST